MKVWLLDQRATLVTLGLFASVSLLLWSAGRLSWDALTSLAAIAAVLSSAHSFSVSTKLTRDSVDQNTQSLGLTRESVEVSKEQLQIAKEDRQDAKAALDLSRLQLELATQNRDDALETLRLSQEALENDRRHFRLASAPLLSIEWNHRDGVAGNPGVHAYLLKMINFGTGIARNVRLTHRSRDGASPLNIWKEHAYAAIAPGQAVNIPIRFDAIQDIIDRIPLQEDSTQPSSLRHVPITGIRRIATVTIHYSDVYNNQYRTLIDFEELNDEGNNTFQFRVTEYEMLDP